MERVELADLSVLLIEPSNVQQAVIAQKLSEQGITSIETCLNMNDALAIIQKYPPDLIFTNLHYEDGTATDLLATLKLEERFIDLPFILISSENRREQLEIFKQSGIIAILAKPFPTTDLKQALQATLSFINHTELTLANYDVDTLKVMVVDDSRLARKAITRILINLGIHNIEELEDGDQAITYLATHEVDLVVTDYNMPNVDGLELTKHIRNSDTHSHVAVLMITSESNETHLNHAHEIGVSAISDKPFDANSIKKLLIKILDH